MDNNLLDDVYMDTYKHKIMHNNANLIDILAGTGKGIILVVTTIQTIY